MKKQIKQAGDQLLFDDLRCVIFDVKDTLSKIITSNIATVYWQIGGRINTRILKNKRADYGKQIVAALSRQLTAEFGRSYKEKNLRRVMQFATQHSKNQVNK